MQETQIRLSHGSPGTQSKQCRLWSLEILEDRLSPATAIWIATIPGDWSDPGNWSTGLVPQSNDIALFSTGSGGSTNNCKLDLNTNIGAILCDYTYTGVMELEPGISLTAGTFTHYGTLVMGDNSSLTINGTFLEYGELLVSAEEVEINATQMQIINDGGVSTSNGSLTVYGTTPSLTPNLTINGELIAAGPVTVGDGGGSAWLQVNGGLVIEGPAATVINLSSELEYNGTVSAEIVNLTLNEGIFTTNVGATLEGTLLCTGATGGLINGNLENAGGTITFGGSTISGLIVTGDYNQFLGTLESRVIESSADRLIVWGDATVGGTIEVSEPLGNSTPITGFAVISGSSLTLDSPTIALPNNLWSWSQLFQHFFVFNY